MRLKTKIRNALIGIAVEDLSTAERQIAEYVGLDLTGEVVKIWEPSPEMVRAAFQSTAVACGSDILEACRTCGEEEVIDRDGLVDYLPTYGGDHGQQILDWICDSEEDTDKLLDEMGVPKTWA